MNLFTKEKLDILENKAKNDVQYQKMMKEYMVLEKQYDLLCKSLTDEQRDIAWQYVTVCEDMSRRMLEIACEC